MRSAKRGTAKNANSNMDARRLANQGNAQNEVSHLRLYLRHDLRGTVPHRRGHTGDKRTACIHCRHRRGGHEHRRAVRSEEAEGMKHTYIVTHKFNEEIIPLWGRFLYCQRTTFTTEHFEIVVESQGRELKGANGVVGEYYADVRNGSYYSMYVYIYPLLDSVKTGCIKLPEYKLCLTRFNDGFDTVAGHYHRKAVENIVKRLNAGDFAGTYDDNVERFEDKRGQLTFL